MRINDRRMLGAVAALAVVATAAAACSSSSNNKTGASTTPTSASSTSTGSAAPPSSSGSSAPSGSGGVGGATANSFTPDYATMKLLAPIAAAGKGKIEVILPDTTTSARYTEFDAPDLAKALQTAGLSASDYTIQNAQGSDSTQLTDAQSAITAGASVLVVDPLDKGVGAQIESYAKQHGVPVIDYDRLTLGGQRSYYVSFDNVKVGELIGNGLVSCISDWHVANPDVIEMKGDPTDNNATLFAQGYDSVIGAKFASNSWKKSAEPAGTWDPQTALTEFQQAYTADKAINAALVPNDENAAPIINYLKTTLKVPANKFPITGQDATLVGLQNVLSGYQCGTVYKSISVEAQAAATLALFLRAGQKPPAALVNGTTKDTDANVDVPSVLLTPVWVTSKNMQSTVIADHAVPVAQLCGGAYAAMCQSAGISAS